MLTKRQKQILDYIKKFIKDKNYSPSFEEIRRHFRFVSKSTVHHYIEILKEKGVLNNQARTIEIVKNKPSPLVKIPLLGTIAAGQPIEAIENRETIAVPKNKLPKSGEFYALRVIGNSMIDENIRDGDVVLIKQRKVEVAENRKGAVVLAHNYKAKLRRFLKKQKRIELQINKKILARKKCPACGQKEDPDGRCRCVNQDAW